MLDETASIDPTGHDDAGAGCPVCGGAALPGFSHCFCCATAVRQLGQPLAPVAAMVDYRVCDRIHHLLRGYKDAPSVPAREVRTAVLAALVELWMADHGERLRHRFGDRWDTVVTVPSTRGRAGSPADALVERVPALARLHLPALVRGSAPIGHLLAARSGFLASPALEPGAVRGRRVLVVDDTLTTGSRAQSAVAALRSGGARVTGILVVGRSVGRAPRRREPRVGPCATRP